MTWYNILLSFIILGVFPLFIGKGFYRILRSDPSSVCQLYILGTFGSWAVCQLVAVPMILMKLPFSTLVIVLSALYLLIVFLGLWKNKAPLIPKHARLEKRSDRIFLAALAAVFILILYLMTTHTYIDDDDSRFVVNAIDMIRTNRMFRTNPATGFMTEWIGELKRDVVSPWAAFQAYISKLSFMFPTIMIHTVQPIAIYLCLFAIQWEISRYLVGEEFVDRSVFCLTLWVIILFCEYNDWTAEGFLLLRVWQGKATVAGVGIPCILLQLFRIYEDETAAEYIVLAIVNFSLCLLSNMGILFGGAMTFVFGLTYAVIKKKWRTVIYCWLAAAPCAVYALLSLIM